MRLLLDTHIFIWFVLSPSQLGTTALAAIQDPQNRIFLSLVSAWEMSIKSGLGKMSLIQPIELFIEDQARRNRLEILPITLPHIAAVERLPQYHRSLRPAAHRAKHHRGHAADLGGSFFRRLPYHPDPMNFLRP